MSFRFHKMHGLGNDFVVIDARTTPVAIDAARARAIADRREGIGCDQVILIEPSDVADARMRIWNSDGGEVEACGNASRAVALLLGRQSTLETLAGTIHLAIDGALATVDMGSPRFGWDQIPLAYAMDTAHLPVGWDELNDPAAVNVGNPHIVFFVDDPEKVDLETHGPSIENDPAFPERINVHVAAVREDGIHMRSWERGAGLTLACGTGACATGVAAIATKRATSPVAVHMPGGSLTISWQPGGPVRMRGAATHVFEGDLDIEALR